MNTSQIKETEAFKSLTKMQQVMLLKKTSLEEIRLGLAMTKLKSFSFWIKTCTPREAIKIVVEELITI